MNTYLTCLMQFKYLLICTTKYSPLCWTFAYVSFFVFGLMLNHTFWSTTHQTYSIADLFYFDHVCVNVWQYAINLCVLVGVCVCVGLVQYAEPSLYFWRPINESELLPLNLSHK